MLREVLGDISKSGSDKEQDYWKAKSGVNAGTQLDQMMTYLNAQGFSGHPRDAFRSWVQSKGGNVGTMFDNTKKYFNENAAP